MKRNAIIRILIWSLVLVLLVGILITTLLGINVSRRFLDSTEAAVLVPVTHPYEKPAEAIEATVMEAVNIRSHPDEDANAVGMLVPGDTVHITEQDHVNGSLWGYILFPQTGWIRMDYVKTDHVQETVVTETSAISETGETVVPTVAGTEAFEEPLVEETMVTVTVPDITITELEIEWVDGSILIEPADVDDILITESEVSDSRYAMQVRRSSKKISIKACSEDILERGWGLNKELNKELTILIPRHWTLGSLEVDTASATMEVNNLVIREVEFDGASGTCVFENCVVDQLDLDTASGDVTFTGTLKTLDCDAASASVEAILDNLPNRIDMDSMSGDLKLTLPEWAGFTVSIDSLSSDFVCQFGYAQKPNGTYVHGDGSCRINMDAMSGDIYIYKQVTAAAIPESAIAP